LQLQHEAAAATKKSIASNSQANTMSHNALFQGPDVLIEHEVNTLSKSILQLHHEAAAAAAAKKKYIAST
jgi:hypothetical protein